MSVLILTASCTRDRDHTQAFQRYMEELTAWAPIEAETVRSIQRILASQFVDEGDLRQEIALAIPRIQTQLGRIDQVNPDQPDLRQINEHYRLAWKALLAGMTAIPAALDHADSPALASSRTALTAWRQSMVDVALELRSIRPDPPPTAP